MNVRRGVGVALEVVAVCFLLAMIAGQLLGQPVLLGYVTTGSMEPTLEPGDGFVAVPSALAGPPEEGDVIAFRAEELHGGGLTTHRVVERTDEGYVTQGDANPFTDQDGDEPPVKEAQIVAVAWQPGGEVLAIPGVGTVVNGAGGTLETIQRHLASLLGTPAILGTQGLAYLVFGASILLYAVDVWRGGDADRRRSRSRRRDDGTDVRFVVAGLAAAVVLSATAAMVVPAGSQGYDVISSEFDSERPLVIERGTNAPITYPIGNGGFLPAYVVLESGSDGVAIDEEDRERRVAARSAENATVVLSAPPETGHYRRYVVEHRYLAILPQAHLRTLYDVHPWAPIVVIDAVLGITFYLGGTALVGTGRVRNRTSDRPSRLNRIISRVT